jgi:hypothetical protein
LDLTKKKVYILKNPSWVCSPCLAFTVNRDPRLLCCRYHSGKDRLYCIKVPTNVLCSLSYEQDDDTLAQVTVVPRTICSFQAKPFSNTFQINRVLGNYSGIDCINLTDQILYPNFRSEISLQRDAICMSARPDFLNFVCGLRKRDRHIDKTNVCRMLDMVRKFSAQGYSTVKEANLTGGTT